MRNNRRRWDAMVEDDPLAGLINLFDLWMVFSIALLLSLATFLKLPPAISQAPLLATQRPAGRKSSRSSAAPGSCRITASVATNSAATASAWGRPTA